MTRKERLARLVCRSFGVALILMGMAMVYDGGTATGYAGTLTLVGAGLIGLGAFLTLFSGSGS